MEYDCTKPLGDKLYEYLESDLDAICEEIQLNGIVFESQFPKLHSMLIKNNGMKICEMIGDRTGLTIIIAYSDKYKMFGFHDLDCYDNGEAIEKVDEYFKD